MKKYLNLFLVLLLCLLLISCGENSGNKTPVENPTSNEDYNENQGVDKETVVANIVANGKSEYTIIYPADYEAGEKSAANEMQSYIEASTGVKIPMVTDENFNGKEDGKYICIGNTIFF